MEGYKSEIYARIGGLYHVSIANYPIRPPAITFLREQRTKGKKVWLLEKYVSNNKRFKNNN